MFRHLLTVSLGVTLTFSALAAQQPAKADQGSKRDLTAKSFSKLHTLIRPHENEWRHLKVEWLTDVVAARKKAVAEDKPIVICYTGGAGYNEPLGVC
jgi:hypothetical protein